MWAGAVRKEKLKEAQRIKKVGRGSGEYGQMDGRGAAEDEERLQQKSCDQQSPFLARIWNQVFNPRLSALFCRLAVKLVEQVCLSSLVLDLYSRA